MNKAIFYKERIKIRRFYPLATAILAGFTAYALLRIGRMYASTARPRSGWPSSTGATCWSTRSNPCPRS